MRRKQCGAVSDPARRGSTRQTHPYMRASHKKINPGRARKPRRPSFNRSRHTMPTDTRPGVVQTVDVPDPLKPLRAPPRNVSRPAPAPRMAPGEDFDSPPPPPTQAEEPLAVTNGTGKKRPAITIS